MTGAGATDESTRARGAERARGGADDMRGGKTGERAEHSANTQTPDPVPHARERAHLAAKRARNARPDVERARGTSRGERPVELTDKVALVTGAGSGIGAATAKRFARAGARVILVGRTADELARVADEIGAAGGQARVAVGDVADDAAVRQLTDDAVAALGRLDVVVANAGVNGVWAPIEELDVEEFASTLRTNLVGTFVTIKHAVPHLKRRGGAVIVTASVNGTRIFSNTGATAYSASKAGQVAMTKMLAVELAKHQIRVNVVCPGAIDTAIDDNTERRDLESAKVPVEYPAGNIPLTRGRPGTSDDVADLMLFLASDAARHVTGTEVWIDGAESLVVG
ncbi:hypothetical protein tb265_42080 [Gemmatimonadetes bacterium T265]|nr:hypothetical protein tb265_42080 [Gemmatimonadetes bacterium T265]